MSCAISGAPLWNHAGGDQPGLDRVTCYATLQYLDDFKAGWSFGEGQVCEASSPARDRIRAVVGVAGHPRGIHNLARMEILDGRATIW